MDRMRFSRLLFTLFLTLTTDQFSFQPTLTAFIQYTAPITAWSTGKFQWAKIFQCSFQVSVNRILFRESYFPIPMLPRELHFLENKSPPFCARHAVTVCT